MSQIVKKNNQTYLQVERDDMGRADTLRYNIISHVVEENYDKAIEELREFLEKDFEYPGFKEKVDRYVAHAIDLVNAIRAKRKFPGIHSLTMAKQQELTERFHEHFNELKYILKRIENIHDELKVSDLRSTVYVIKALVNASVAIVAVAFFLEATRGLGSTMFHVLDDFFVNVASFIAGLF